MKYLKLAGKHYYKRAADMKAGEVIRVAFGEEENVGLVVFERCEAVDKDTTIIYYHCPERTETQAMYDHTPIEKVVFEIAGEECDLDVPLC